MLDKDILEDMVSVVEQSFELLDTQLSYNTDETLMRRLSTHYDTLTVEQVAAIQQATGHKDGEDKPCKVCKLIARKEYDLIED